MTTLRTALVTALTVSLATSACGGSKTPAVAAPTPAASQPHGVVTTASAAVHRFGEAADVIGGNNASPVTLTPVGVLYSKGPYRGTEGPANGWFIAIAVHAVPTKFSETLQPPTGGFAWEAGDRVLTESQGNASNTPWAAEVPVFSSDQPIAVGQTRLGIVTFDVPKKGGVLTYANPDQSGTIRWQIPATDTGTGLDSVRKRIKLFS
ncbi:MAG: hypothetical protein JWN52_3582 [Actinomycetia bacterium]|nr:hypothetical protein [Actinomycetes bacterium]